MTYFGVWWKVSFNAYQKTIPVFDLISRAWLIVLHKKLNLTLEKGDESYYCYKNSRPTWKLHCESQKRVSWDETE